jgi:hypothetical protein
MMAPLCDSCGFLDNAFGQVSAKGLYCNTPMTENAIQKIYPKAYEAGEFRQS